MRASDGSAWAEDACVPVHSPPQRPPPRLADVQRLLPRSAAANQHTHRFAGAGADEIASRLSAVH
jgi:hypothetical protein